MELDNESRRFEQRDLPELIAAHIAGEDAAADALCKALHEPVLLAIGKFLAEDSADRDDVEQETLLAVLGYLRRNRGFAGDLVKFAVTIASNRCRDILRSRRRKPQVPIDSLTDWIADHSRSPLDFLLEEEVLTLLRTALERVGAECRTLLRAMYIDEIPTEQIRRRLGLKTVQGVYYRRTICLKEAFRLLTNRLSDRSLADDREP